MSAERLLRHDLHASADSKMGGPMTLDDLRAYGADVELGLSRCMGSEELYLMLVGTIPGEEKFAMLETSIAEGNLDTAFEAAHALKGILANLALTPLHEPVYQITEFLRARTRMDYSSLLAEIFSARDRLSALL